MKFRFLVLSTILTPVVLAVWFGCLPAPSGAESKDDHQRAEISRTSLTSQSVGNSNLGMAVSDSHSTARSLSNARSSLLTDSKSREQRTIDAYTMSKIAKVRKFHSDFANNHKRLMVIAALEPHALMKDGTIRGAIQYLQDAHRLIDDLGRERVASQMGGIDGAYLLHEDFEKQRGQFETLVKRIFTQQVLKGFEDQLARDKAIREGEKRLEKINRELEEFNAERARKAKLRESRRMMHGGS